VPGLAHIHSWDIEHLYRAATDWAATAEHWEDSFTAVHSGTLSPGGTMWEGQAAEAAQERTFGEMASEEKHGLPPRGKGLSHRARAFLKLAEACLEHR